MCFFSKRGKNGKIRRAAYKQRDKKNNIGFAATSPRVGWHNPAKYWQVAFNQITLRQARKLTNGNTKWTSVLYHLPNAAQA
jgi:hypothetical protein